MPRKFAGKPFSVSLLSGAENFWIREGVGSIKIFCQKFFFSQCRKISWVNPFVLCFRKISVVKRFMDKRGVEYQDFPSKTFFLTVPRIFVGKPFSVSLPSGAEKVWIREGVGSIKIFFRNFSSQNAEDFRGETF